MLLTLYMHDKTFAKFNAMKGMNYIFVSQSWIKYGLNLSEIKITLDVIFGQQEQSL